MSNQHSNKNQKQSTQEEKSKLEELPIFYEHTDDSRTVMHNGKVVQYHLPRGHSSR